MRGNSDVLVELIFVAEAVPFLAAIICHGAPRDLQLPAVHLLAILCSREEAKLAAVCFYPF